MVLHTDDQKPPLEFDVELVEVAVEVEVEAVEPIWPIPIVEGVLPATAVL
jgi:hypothetical protein